MKLFNLNKLIWFSCLYNKMDHSSMEDIGESLNKLYVGFKDVYDKSQSDLQNSETSRKANSSTLNNILRNVNSLEKQFHSITNEEVSSSTTKTESPESDVVIDVVGNEGPSGSSNITLFESILNGDIPSNTVNQANWTDISSTSSSDASSNAETAAVILKSKLNAAKTSSKRSMKSKTVRKIKYVPPNLDSTDSDEDCPKNKTSASASDATVKPKSQSNLKDPNIKYKADLHLDGKILLVIKKVKKK